MTVERAPFPAAQPFGAEPGARRVALGSVVSGSLTRGLEVRLEVSTDVEALAVGRYVTVQGDTHRFFGMITDVELRTTADAVQKAPPSEAEPFLREVYRGTAAYAVLKVMPMLRMALDGGPAEPVRTVPPHFASAFEATQQEVSSVFGHDDADHFPIGMPVDMDVEICLDYQRFVERSNGIFGKTGTGKSYLTRNILLHLIAKSRDERDPGRQVVHLVFDMHNDYGWAAKNEETGHEVKGLRQILGTQVCVLSLDPDSSRRRGAKVDGAVTIRYEDIEAADLAVLQETLNLSSLAVDAAFSLAQRFPKGRWLKMLLDGEEFEEGSLPGSIHPASLESLRRGVARLGRSKAFLVESGSEDSVTTILAMLASGRSVVLEFGRYGNDLVAYMLVANVLTRRIHEDYRHRVESSMGDRGSTVNRLMITIEEAHKFLSPAVAGQTIFGEIAREMRKYNVTLLVVDQRPSAIDEEVLSQIATKVSCLLDNERDVDAVLGGISGGRELRSVLAKLETKRQALILGHAVPMPVVVRTEEFGSEDSYKRFSRTRDLGSADDLY